MVKKPGVLKEKKNLKNIPSVKTVKPLKMWSFNKQSEYLTDYMRTIA